MAYAAVPIPNGTWGFDCDTPLTDALMDKIFAELRAAHGDAAANPVVVRYFGLHGPAASDLSAPELARILARPERPYLLAVQHVFGKQWRPTAVLGQQLGLAIAACAKACGYIAGAHVCSDMEDTDGTDGTPFLDAWQAAHPDWPRGVYEGYMSGLSGAALLALGCPIWCDYGNRILPGGETYTAKQHYMGASSVYDADQFFVDSRGQAFVAMRLVDDVVATADPHVDPGGTNV